MKTPECNPNDNRRGLITTILFHVALVLLFIFYGLTYQDPPPEDGITLNFGYEEDGSGTTTQSAPAQSTPQTSEHVDEEVATQEMEDAPSVNTEKPKKPVEKPVENPKQEQKPDSRLQGALDRTKNQQGDGQGEGETDGGGDQGDPNGDRNNPNRNGNGGGGGNGNYILGGRDALNTPEPEKGCNESGRVVVRVYVDRTGKVLKAYAGEQVPGGKGSTTTSPCLYEKARNAAMRTTWSPNAKALEMQSGYIIYDFKLKN